MTASSLLPAGPDSTKSPAPLPVSDSPSDLIRVVRNGLSAWYDGGDRLAYDPQARALRSGELSLQVFVRREGGHSHPWWTTPVLRRLGDWMPQKAPFGVFMTLAGVMWSRRFPGRDKAGRRVYESLRRHGGYDFLRRAAGFVADHKAEGERLDFGRLFMAFRDRFPFLVGGSEEDAFEHRQVDLA